MSTVTVYKREPLSYVKVGETENDIPGKTVVGSLTRVDGATYVVAVNLPRMPPGTNPTWDYLLYGIEPKQGQDVFDG